MINTSADYSATAGLIDYLYKRNYIRSEVAQRLACARSPQHVIAIAIEHLLTGLEDFDLKPRV